MAAASSLEQPALVAGVEEVLLDGVIALGLGIHWNAMLGAVRQQIRSPLERFDEFGISPRGDGPDLGVQGLGAHFESHLIVPLPGGAVGHVGRPLLGGDAHHLLGDARPRHGRPEQVPSLVDGIAFERLVELNKSTTLQSILS